MEKSTVLNAVDFIKRVKNEGKALTVYHLSKELWHADDDTAGAIDIEGFYDNRDEAVKAMKETADGITPEFGFRIEVTLWKADISVDDLDEVDWDSVEDMGDAAYGDGELLEVFNEHRDFDDSIYVDYKYESVEGALLVFWSWHRYIGYARDLGEIREGWYGEDESICIKRDKTFVTQCDVLIGKDELEGLSRDDRRALIEQRLGESHWKWTMKAESVIRHYLRDEFGQDEED